MHDLCMTDATVTNDGATILKSVWIDNPAARSHSSKFLWNQRVLCPSVLWRRILVDISKTQASGRQGLLSFAFFLLGSLLHRGDFQRLSELLPYAWDRIRNVAMARVQLRRGEATVASSAIHTSSGRFKTSRAKDISCGACS